jgi:hypothetical protein
MTLDAMKRPSWLQRSAETPQELPLPAGVLQAAAECVTGAAVWTISYALRTINDGTTAAAREVEATDVSCSLSAGEERGDGDNKLHVVQPRTCK